MYRLYIDGEALSESNISGIGHIALEMTKALIANRGLEDWDKVVFVPRGRRSRVVQRGIPAEYVNDRMPRSLFRVLARAKTMFPIDILLGRGIYIFPNISNWKLSAQSFSITYVHDAIFSRFPDTVAPKNLSYLVSNMNRWVRNANVVATVSEFSADELKNVLPEVDSKLKVFKNGVNLKVFTPRSAQEVSAVKQKLSIEKDYLLYVGNLEPRKNVDMLIDGYVKLPAGLKRQYQLVLISGGGWGDEALRQKITSLIAGGEQIIWPQTYVEDDMLPALYSGAATTVLFSVYEGFGLSPLQALACGSLVAVSDIPSIREVVSDCGFYARTSDSTSIGDTISEALQADPKTREQLRANGFKRAESYSWEETIKPLLKIIKNRYIT